MALKPRKFSELSPREPMAARLFPRLVSKEIRAEMAKQQEKKPPQANRNVKRV
jgi:hypothetical protein